jgi:DNA-binding transcriptional LysR family regulator
MTELHLGPLLARVAACYPDIKIEISTDDGAVDIISDRFDAGIQWGVHVADNMVAVRLSAEARRSNARRERRSTPIRSGCRCRSSEREAASRNT